MYIPGLEKAVERWWSRWVRRGRTGPAPFAADGSGWVLTYTARYRLTAFLLFALFTAAYVVAWRSVFRADSWRHVAGAVGSVLLWLFLTGMLVSSLIEQVTVTAQQLRRRSWRGRQALAWSDVHLVWLADETNVLKIGGGGTVIDVSLFLDGLHALADVLDRHPRAIPQLLEDVLPPRAGYEAGRS
jgi:hypothetical protein